MRGEKDRSSKWMLNTYGDRILRGLAGLQGRIVSWRALQPEVVQPKQLPDGVLEVMMEGEEKPDRFLVEIATFPEKRVTEQMMRDAALVYLDQRRLPEAVTLVLAPKGKAVVPGEVEEKSRLGWATWGLKWRVVNLWDLPAEQILAMNDVGLVPWVPLTKFDGPAEPVLRECRKRIDEQAPTQDHDNLLAVCQMLGRLRYDLPTLAAIFGEKQDMIESPFFQDILEDPEIIKQSPVYRELLAKSAQTRQEDLQQSVLQVLAVRFQSVPDDVAAAIRAINEPDRLKALVGSAAQCPSLEEFRSHLPS
jgi:hypothetical protein